MGDSKVSQSQLSEEFIKNFNLKKDALNERISKLCPDDGGSAEDKLSEIASEIQKLSKSLHDAVMFLPSYSVKIRQNEIRELERLLKEKEDILIPKKKFGFRSKSRPAPSAGNTTEPEIIKSQKSEGITKPSMTSNYFTIENLNGKTVKYEEDALNSNDVMVKNSENCIIVLAGSPSTLHVVNLKNCKLICGPVRTSIFVEKVTDSTLFLCCHQLRTHSSDKLDVYLRVVSRAIIEDCTNVRFGPYSWDHDKSEEWHKNAEIDKNLERYDAVDDFNWLSATPSPNWTVIPHAEHKTFNAFRE